MYKKTILASLMAAMSVAHANASDNSSNMMVAAPTAATVPQLKSMGRDISDLYFIHFNSEPLGLAAKNGSGIMAANANSGAVDINSMASISYRSQLATEQATAQAQISKTLGRKLAFEHQYDLVINAATVRLSKAEAEALANHPAVSMVDKVTMHQLHTDSGPDFIGADQIWNGLNDEMPTKGEGIVVGIIDTGIDADHPSFSALAADGYQHINPLGEGNYLGDCQTVDICNDKLIGVVSWDDLREYYPEETVDGFDRPEIIATGWDFHGHGTHVASTVAGNPLTDLPIYNANGDLAQFKMPKMSGVAPRANIVSYQVCLPAMDDSQGGCFPDLTVRAIEHAIENNVKVLNYSVGGGASSPWLVTDALAFLNARAFGIHVATSAGNSGPSPQTVGSPGNAPWITTVAAYTHDRGYSDKYLTNFSGGDTTLEPIMGRGATYALENTTIVDAANFGDGDCLNPFADGTFNGEIVLCRRGDIARVAKGANVQAGGAGGLVLVNVSDDANNIVADAHSLPAIHLYKDDGQALIDWLASGSGHSATIEASEQIKDDALGDIAGVFTSRGPNYPYGELLAPDVAGPGVDIYAGHTTEYPFSTAVPPEYTFMSGTSMSSPHVAGAMALIHAMRPDWTPAQVQSALMTTAKTNTYTDDDGDGALTPSTPYDAGAGRIQVAQAVQAALLLDVTEQEYLDADPANGGDPKTLNQASMVAVGCVDSCSWTRTVTAERAGNWTSNMVYDVAGFDMTVSPASFSLEAGGSQELTITVTANDQLTQQFTHGRVELMADGEVTQHLTVVTEFSAGLIPEPDPTTRGPVIAANGDQGSHTMEGFKTIASDELQIQTFGLSKVQVHEGATTGDVIDNSNPVDDLDNLHWVSVNAYASTRALAAWIDAAEAPDLDLYITRDADLNGKPSFIEMVMNYSCISGRTDSQESCVIDNPQPGTYLVIVHNYEGTAEGAIDSHKLLTSVLGQEQGNFEVVTPGAVEQGQEFSVDIEWDQPMNGGDIYLGAFTMGTSPDTPANVGTVMFELHRAATPLELNVDVAEVVADAPVTYTLTVNPNDSGADRNLVISAQVPAGYAIDSADGAQIDGDMVTWTINQANGDAGSELSLVVSADNVMLDNMLAVSFSYSVDGTPGESVVADEVMVKIPATAMINGKTSEALELQSPASTTLSADASVGTELSYQWTQLSGPDLMVSGDDSATLAIEVPALESDATAEFQLVVTGSNGLASEPVMATLTLLAEAAPAPTPSPDPQPSSSSSGSLGGWMLLMLAGALIRRRR